MSITIIGGIHYGKIYYHIGKTGREYEKSIKNAITNQLETVSLPLDRSYNIYLWEPYPDERRAEYFKRFYGLDESVNLTIDIEECLKDRKDKKIRPWN